MQPERRQETPCLSSWLPNAIAARPRADQQDCLFDDSQRSCAFTPLYYSASSLARTATWRRPRTSGQRTVYGVCHLGVSPDALSARRIRGHRPLNPCALAQGGACIREHRLSAPQGGGMLDLLCVEHATVERRAAERSMPIAGRLLGKVRCWRRPRVGQQARRSQPAQGQKPGLGRCGLARARGQPAVRFRICATFAGFPVSSLRSASTGRSCP